MRRLAIFAAAAALTALTAAAPGASSGELCYDLDVNVAGTQVADEEGCAELPATTNAAGSICYDIVVGGDPVAADCVDLPV